MNIKPLFRYRIKEGLLGVGSYTGVLFLVIGLMLVAAYSSSGAGRMNFTAVGTASAIFFLVWGLVTIREDIRMGLQFGLSRRTIFVANLAAALVVSIVAAAAGELLIAAGQAMAAGRDNLVISDLYQLVFLDGATRLSASQHLANALFNFTVQWVCYGCGLLLSLLYFRLSKLGIIILSVAGGLAVLGLFPYLIYRFAAQLKPFLLWLWSSLGNWTLTMGLLTLTFLVGSFLLLRRAPVKSIK